MNKFEMERFLNKWSKVILKRAKEIASRDRSEVAEVDGAYLKRKFREATGG